MLRKILYLIAAVIIAIILTIVICDIIVVRNASGRTFNDVDDIPHRQVGLVLGTSPISTWSGLRNWYFDERISSAADLYKAGKVDYLIVSGGDYRNEGGYDEPTAMRDSLIGHGVDSIAIILDYDGTRTLNSIAKVKDVYSTDSITIISQQFHNERALYQADHLGVDAISYNALTPLTQESPVWWRNRGRECLARVKLFVDIIRGVKPDIRETAQRKLPALAHPLLTFADVTTPYADLLCITPDMELVDIDLLCGEVPDAGNDSIVIAFAGAFTGENGDKLHTDIAGDHVSAGVLHRGYKCRWCNGTFTWTVSKGPQFFYNDNGQALADAAKEGGMGFCQEMMIHDGKAVPTTRPSKNKNQFRALCMTDDDNLAIFESRGRVEFGDFINALLEAGVKDAIYTDMGPGWNYCFYRQQLGQPASFLHNQPHILATNFVVIKAK